MVDDWEREYGGVREARREVREAKGIREFVRMRYKQCVLRFSCFFHDWPRFICQAAQTDRLLTSQADRSEVKREASSNMSSILSPLDVFHLLRSDLNELAL